MLWIASGVALGALANATIAYVYTKEEGARRR
jgi:hypothetical protein